MKDEPLVAVNGPRDRRASMACTPVLMPHLRAYCYTSRDAMSEVRERRGSTTETHPD